MEYSDCIYESVRSLSILEINSLCICCKIFLNRHLFLLFENKFNIVMCTICMVLVLSVVLRNTFLSLPFLHACGGGWGKRERMGAGERDGESRTYCDTNVRCKDLTVLPRGDFTVPAPLGGWTPLTSGGRPPLWWTICSPGTCHWAVSALTVASVSVLIILNTWWVNPPLSSSCILSDGFEGHFPMKVSTWTGINRARCMYKFEPLADCPPALEHAGSALPHSTMPLKNTFWKCCRLIP